MEAFHFSLPLHRFDLNLLPPGARKIGSPEFKNAVIEHFVREYADKGETAIVTVDDEEITVVTAKGTEDPFGIVVKMLQGGRIKEALPLLESIATSRPDNPEVAYNLGIAYSELGRFEDAIVRLKKAVALRPAYSHAWTGIGVAYQRLGKSGDAQTALRKAVEADPGDGYAHRNLGAVLATEGKLPEALLHLREAFHQLPGDAQAMFGLARCLESLGGEDNLSESDKLYAKFIERFPASPMAETARTARTKFAQRNLRAAAPGGFRPDVMMYITGAIETFRNVGPRKRQEIAMEIALLGRRGLDINDPTEKYTLRTLPGTFSGLHLVAIMYTAFKQIDPSLDSGADFSAEYRMAQQMSGNGS